MDSKNKLSWLRRTLISMRHKRMERKLGLPSVALARAGAAGGFYMGGGVILTRVLNRHILYLPSRDTSLVPGLLLHGMWERAVTRTLASLIRPGMVVGDVGANVGYFTVMMAARVGPTGHVHAFEPNAELCTLLSRSMFVSGFSERTTIHEVALGDQDGHEMLLCLPPTEVDALGGASLVPVQDHEVPNSFRVMSRRLDAMPDADRIELLKIDAEGWEPAIWAGMEGMLKGTALRTILMEYSSLSYSDAGGFLDSIVQAGFHLRLIDPDLGVVETSMSWLLDEKRHNQTLMLLLTR